MEQKKDQPRQENKQAAKGVYFTECHPILPERTKEPEPMTEEEERRMLEWIAALEKAQKEYQAERKRQKAAEKQALEPTP